MSLSQHESPQVLKRIRQAQSRGLFAGNRRGIEKESLRVTPTGNLSSAPHPIQLGRALTHPLITTDFAESLLEFVTEPYQDHQDVLNELFECHQFAQQHIGNEVIWNSSMPSLIRSDDEISEAFFGNSNSGKMKHIYRRGLSHRYGKRMQTIAGIHYNFSFGTEFWEKYKTELKDDSDMKDFVNARYFVLIRNYLRYVWVIPYLLGCSPALSSSFLKGHNKPEFLLPLNSTETLIAPHGTSLRMSNIGYSNNSKQHELHVSYDDLRTYLGGLCKALRQKVDTYEEIGIKGPDGEWRQLNTNLLQIENEFYNPIRPKQPIGRGERVTKALIDRGVSYIEVRAIDINPFLPVGIDETTMRFLDVFLTFCLLEKSSNFGEEESTHMKSNLQKTAANGRDPNLMIYDVTQNQERLLKDWLGEILDTIESIAQEMDEDEGNNSGAGKYVAAVREQIEKLKDPSRLPSNRLLEEIKKSDFFEFTMRQSQSHLDLFKSLPFSEQSQHKFVRLAEKSILEQDELEKSSKTVPFEDYLTNYFHYKEPCSKILNCSV